MFLFILLCDIWHVVCVISLSVLCMFRLSIKDFLINSLIKYGLATHNGGQPISQGSFGCLTSSQAIPKLWTHNLVCRLMHVSEWSKRTKLVLGPKVGGDSIFTFFLVYSRLGHTSHEKTTCCRHLHPYLYLGPSATSFWLRTSLIAFVLAYSPRFQPFHNRQASLGTSGIAW